MNCPKCLQDVPAGSTCCPYCATSFLSGDPLTTTPIRLPAPPPPAPPAKEAPAALRILSAVGGILSIIVIGLMNAALVRGTYPSMSSEAVGYWVGTCIGVFLFAAIVVLLYAKLNKRKHVPVYLFGATCGIALLWSFVGVVPQLAKLKSEKPGDVQQRIKKLAKEGTGQAPVSGNQGKFDDIIRPFFGDIKKFNDDYLAEAAALDSSALQALYGAKSFDGDENISRVLEQLRAMKAVEDKYASIDPLLQKTKERLFASSASEAEKTAFWNSFESSFRKSIEPRNAVNASEHAWLTDSIGFYEFMQANENSFHVKNNKVLFTSTDLLNEYNERIDKVDTERKAFLATKEKFEQAQKEGLGKMGLQPSDFDAPNGKAK